MNRKAKGTNRLAAAVLAVLMLFMTSAPALAETFSAIVTSTSMPVYKNQALTTKTGALSKNTIVRVTSYSGKAARISYSGKTGYAKVSDMTAVESIASKALIQGSAKVYQTASTRSKSVSVNEGTPVYVLATSGSWAQIERNGVVGYVSTFNIAKADDNWEAVATPVPAPTSTADSGVVVGIFEAKAAKSVTVYKTASTSGKKLGTLKKGQSVTVGAYSNSWAYIRLNGKYGFCKLDALTPVSGDDVTPVITPAPTATPEPNGYAITGTVTASKLTVRQSPSTSAKSLGTLKKGQSVNVITWNSNWAYIELNGRYGYCSSRYLNLEDTDPNATPTPYIGPTATPSTDNAIQGTVVVTSLPVYNMASGEATKLGTLGKGQVVNVLKTNSGWAFIELDGNYGFCELDGLSPAGDVNPTVAPTPTPSIDKAIRATVSANSAVVYQLASTTSTKLGTLEWGDQVNVLSISGEWAYIELDGVYGFCRAATLTRDEDDVDGDYKSGGFDATVIYPGALVYETASTDSKSVSLALGTTVSVYAYSADWACIINGTTRGFIPVKHLNRNSYSTISGDGSALQTLLKGLMSYGYYDAVPGTSYNTQAANAIKRFQAACGLTQNGVADEALQRILYGGYAPADEILTKAINSSSGSALITRLQTRLYALGYLSKAASVDGEYGTTTSGAISLFQSANKLTASGAADVATLKAIYSPSAVSKPSSVKAADVISSTVVDPKGTVKLSSTYVTTMPSALKSTTSSYSSSMSSAQKLEHVIYSAQQKLGCTYVYGATGPSTFDCSGLTLYSFKKVGTTLKRSAYSQGYDSSYSKISSVGSLKRGDLVFFNTISDSDLCDHVGIYLGGGCFIHASSGGHKVVVSTITSGYYNRVFSWGRRVLK